MKSKFVKAYLDVAERFAQLSSATRLKVGAIIVKDDRIVSIGYNGTPAGWDNNCEDRIYPDRSMGDYEQHTDEFDAMFPFRDEEDKLYRLKTKPEVIHAERNAIDKLARGTEAGLGSTMFVTHSPCLECSKSIYTSGIKKIYYRDAYRDNSGIEFLQKCGLEIEQVK